MEKHSNDNENLKALYRWKALDEKNVIEQFSFDMVHYTSLTPKEKESG
jgi:hypothetical protein